MRQRPLTAVEKHMIDAGLMVPIHRRTVTCSKCGQKGHHKGSPKCEGRRPRKTSA